MAEDLAVRSFLTSKGLAFHPAGPIDYAVKRCIRCGDEGGHLFINKQTGLWNCKKCGASGNLWHLRRELEGLDPVASIADLMKQRGYILDPSVAGELTEQKINEFHANLCADSSAIRYLIEERKLTKDTIRHFRIGLTDHIDADYWLTIPYVLDGQVTNIKYRTLPLPSNNYRKDFRMVSNAKKSLFNADGLNPSQDCYVTEGEFDAMAMWQNGFPNAVSIPLGAQGFPVEAFDKLIGCGRIFMLYDSDAAGENGVREASGRLGGERCFYVKLPCKDANDFFKAGHAPSDMQALIDDAKTVVQAAVVGVTDAFSELKEEIRRKRTQSITDVSWPFDKLNAMLGVLEPGWLVILQSPPKIGKTTFSRQMCVSLARKDIPAMLYCLEMRRTKQVELLIAQERAVKPNSIRDEDIDVTAREFAELPLYLGHATGTDISADRVFDTIRYAVKRFGVRFVVFDHLHFLTRSLNNTTSETGKIVRGFKLLFEELGIPGIVIAHPKKCELENIPGMYAARDSGEIPGDADLLLTLYRKPLKSGSKKVTEEDFVDSDISAFDYRCIVDVTACRFTSGGRAILYWDDSRLCFTDVDPKPRGVDGQILGSDGEPAELFQ
jgi:hypothetical protein